MTYSAFERSLDSARDDIAMLWILLPQIGKNEREKEDGDNRILFQQH